MLCFVQLFDVYCVAFKQYHRDGRDETRLADDGHVPHGRERLVDVDKEVRREMPPLEMDAR